MAPARNVLGVLGNVLGGTPESVAEASEAPESVAESSEIPILTYLFDNFPNPNGVCLQGDGYANCM